MSDIINCDACPVLCRIREGCSGACDRYANSNGTLVRVDPLVVLQRTIDADGSTVPFLEQDWDGAAGEDGRQFVTGIGAATTYPDYKPAPFIVASTHDGVDMVTVVTEGIFSYCGVKVKIDTDRFLGPEGAPVRRDGQAVGHVTTGEYGSQMLSLGGVHHLTGAGKAEGRVTCQTLLELCNRKAVELSIDGGASVLVQAGRPPVVNGVPEDRMRVGCGSATIGIFARQWAGVVDEVVVVDDHITGVLTEHKAGRYLGLPESGVAIRGRRSTLGRYFQVANPGTGWGGTDITDPLSIIEGFDAKHAHPGLRLLMVSTTGEHFGYYVLDEALTPVSAPMPEAVMATVERVRENCEPAMCTVLFIAGAGGSLRAGVTENPVLLTQSVKKGRTHVTCGGAPTYVWPGGGITFMVDVSLLPENAFGSVPTPALVAPVEFTMRLDDYVAMGGHAGSIVRIEQLERLDRRRVLAWAPGNPWPMASHHYSWGGRAG